MRRPTCPQPNPVSAARRRLIAAGLAALAALLLGLGLSRPAWAQTPSPEFVLYVRRNFGYGGGGQIQGSFRLEVEGPADLAAVTYRIDGTVITTTTQAPFRVDFRTEDYALGQHSLTAEGRTAAGQTLTAAPRQFEFVGADVGTQTAFRLVVPLLGGVLGVMAIAFVVSMLPTWLGRRKPLPLGAPRDYGAFGGTVCPKCGRPFARHLWGLNAGLGTKFDRCDHCGKWSFVRRASPEALQAAEAAERSTAGSAGQPPAPDQGLQREIDDSRYVD